MPWRCGGPKKDVLLKWDADKARWVHNPAQPKEKTHAACERMKRALYANMRRGGHAKTS